MVLPGYGLLYINSIRQTLALVFSMLASYVLMNVVGGKSIWKLFIKTGDIKYYNLLKQIKKK